jgi:hypothetical protein
MVGSSTCRCAKFAMTLFALVCFLFKGIVQGQLTDPSTVQIGDTVWYVSLAGFRNLYPRDSSSWFSLVVVFLPSYEGYVMDYFCINRGTLFDNPDVITLENPGVHSVHWYVQRWQAPT